jgi:uncharacterized oxidoreductase
MIIQAGPLEKATAAIFVAAGCEPGEADCVARHLVDSNLCGHDSHGVIRIARYLGFMKNGTVRPGQHAKVVFENATALVIDGNMGFGQVIGEETMNRLAPMAKKVGMALATIRNCGHAGRLGDWAEQLAQHGLISMHFLNTTGLGMMAMPFGGSDRRLSLNPLAICVPVAGRPPVLLDITTTTVAEGKLAVARNKGEKVPLGTIVDKAGNPTTDPNDFYAGGALLTVGGHKGYGLNVVTDLLSGGLSGGGCTRPGVTVMANTMTSLGMPHPGMLGQMSTVSTRTGFRAATPDKLPLIGPWPGDESLFLATGHEGLGITTSLATARILVDQIMGTEPEIPIEPYLPSRAAKEPAHAE